MQAEELIEKGADAIRVAKYQCGGNHDRKSKPVNHIERRYATAAIVAALRGLAEMRLRLTPDGLEWWAQEVEKAGGDQ